MALSECLSPQIGFTFVRNKLSLETRLCQFNFMVQFHVSQKRYLKNYILHFLERQSEKRQVIISADESSPVFLFSCLVLKDLVNLPSFAPIVVVWPLRLEPKKN